MRKPASKSTADSAATRTRYIFDMSIRIRTVLMWLLLLALPMQGYATATMVSCGPNHHRMAAAAQLVDAVSASATAHHSHHGMQGPHAHEASAVADEQDTRHLSPASKFKCSACATCCVGAALPITPLVFAAAAPSGAPSSVFSIGPIGFQTDGPDRPPRTLLA